MPFRLFIGFLCCLALSLACWWILPRVGVWLPPWLPLVGYAIILGAILITSAPPPKLEGEHDPLSELDPHTDVSSYKFRHPSED